VNSPPRVPAVHSNPVQVDGNALADEIFADDHRSPADRHQRHGRGPRRNEPFADCEREPRATVGWRSQ